MHSKVAILTELGRFPEALQAIAAYPAAQELAFEKAGSLRMLARPVQDLRVVAACLAL